MKLSVKITSKQHRKYLRLFAIILVIASSFYLGHQYFSPNTPDPNLPKTLGKTINSKQLNSTLTLPVKSKDGDLTTQTINYHLTSADITDQIIIKDKLANSQKNKVFLVITATLENPNPSPVTIRSRDYLRLQTDSTESISPTIHNDPFVISQNSKQQVTLGFSIAKTASNLHLVFGLTGNQITIPLEFE